MSQYVTRLNYEPCSRYSVHANSLHWIIRSGSTTGNLLVVCQINSRDMERQEIEFLPEFFRNICHKVEACYFQTEAVETVLGFLKIFG
jgi:hypothetical protein